MDKTDIDVTYFVEIIFKKEIKMPYTDTYSDSICYTDVENVFMPTEDSIFLEIHFGDSTQIYFSKDSISSIQVNDMSSIDESLLLTMEDEDPDKPDKGDLN